MKKIKLSNKKIIIIIVAAVFVCVLVGLLLAFVFKNKIELKESTVVVNYGKKYKEPGYKVVDSGKDYTKKVKTKDNINYKKLGTYKVEYQVKIDSKVYKNERTVIIKDTEKPKIKLKGSKNTDVCPNTEYKEEGYEVTDNYDKNLTKKVKVEKYKEKIVYSVSDSSNNKATVTRKLTYQDKTPPTIKLNGSETVNVVIGTSYNDEGAKATDNCDGDVSKKIKKSGEVDINKLGTYEIKYKAKDKASNEGTATRKVNVINASSNSQGIPGTIYLTFDDGPNEGTTNVILDILKEEGVKATFFVTNNGPDNLIKREFEEGHTVALHTATHNYALLYSSDENYYNDLKQVQDRVKRITGQTSMIIRFPGGASNTVSRKDSPGIMSRLTQSTIAKGYKYYDWNISSGDAGGTTSSSGIYNNVVSQLNKEKANMVLMHDIKTYTRDALRQIIQFGKANGYEFKKITMDTTMVTQRVNN